MRIGFYLSTMGGSPLQVGLERGLIELGHQVTYGQGQDLTVVFNQCSHTLNYVYPEPWPTGKIAFVDTAEYGYFKRLPGVAQGYHNAFSVDSFKHDTKNEGEQRRLFQYLNGRCFPYFIREYLKFLPFPSSYYPIDYPLYRLSANASPPVREEYLSRSKPLWLSWGLSHPWRKHLGEQIRRVGGVEVLEINEVSERIPQDIYFASIAASRCSVSFDGYGSSSFRLTEAIVRTVLLRGPLSMKSHFDLTDQVNCVDYEIVSEGETFLSTNITEKLLWVLDHPEEAYRIYEKGYHDCMEHLSERATAQYFLNTVEKHDYSQPTQLAL